jgi:ABC-2 type transport system permease protein/oleandomycin transport system permease protein
MAVFSSIQPIMFVLLFRYVFGNSITLADPSIAYVDYLMPGINGADRGVRRHGHRRRPGGGPTGPDRAVPLAAQRPASAVLAGRTMADSVRNVF